MSSLLPVGYRFEKSHAGYVLLARHGEIVSQFYTPEDPDAGVIAALHRVASASVRNSAAPSCYDGRR